jgi:hypothetical protein
VARTPLVARLLSQVGDVLAAHSVEFYRPARVEAGGASACMMLLYNRPPSWRLSWRLFSPQEELLELCNKAEKAADAAEGEGSRTKQAAVNKVLGLLEDVENFRGASSSVLKRSGVVKMFKKMRHHSCEKVRDAVEEILTQWQEKLCAEPTPYVR